VSLEEDGHGLRRRTRTTVSPVAVAQRSHMSRGRQPVQPYGHCSLVEAGELALYAGLSAHHCCHGRHVGTEDGDLIVRSAYLSLPPLWQLPMESVCNGQEGPARKFGCRIWPTECAESIIDTAIRQLIWLYERVGCPAVFLGAMEWDSPNEHPTLFWWWCLGGSCHC
jgi:hypothetical protein